ncbi:hypothetical protein [Paeniglutamicibacter terrestris]|uniref:Uncharacterized protein n=1 Tax=Paeniglutamicibacter terrestris TaxID=2723403 RepID=A0ABX1G7L6_9MICC|nr:hypothetical protein [Paeniglutamicibacter terrestris]NKG22229.1 hypothetical protein [Paeniglutamicibacter terrestris]
MKHLTDAIRSAATQQNWYSALTLALTMPDICSKLARPNAKPGPRFVEWVDKNFTPKYTSPMPGLLSDEKMIWISGTDFYALRCAVLHEGSFDTTKHMKNEIDRVFREFMFTASPPNGKSAHCNSIHTTLQLDVRTFANDVADSVDVWESNLKPESATLGRMRGLMTIAKTEADGAVVMVIPAPQ